MMRVLVCSLSTYGFVLPTATIALALTRQGHEVALATAPDLADWLAVQGLRRIPRGEQDGPSFQVQTWFLPIGVVTQVKHIQYALEQFEPDLIVTSSLCLGPLLMAEHLGLPIVVLGLGNYLWPTGDMLDGGEAKTILEARRVGRHKDMVGYFNEARQAFGHPAIDPSYRSSPLLGDLYLLQSVPELAGPPSRFPAKVRLVGSCLWASEQHDQELSDWLEQGTDDILYVQIGRSFEIPSPWPVIAEALSELPVRVVASVGRADASVEVDSRRFFVRDHVPQFQVLHGARLVITGGNSTAMLGALSHGLPMLILPGGGEQLEAAYRCSQAGAAIEIPASDVTPADVRASVEELLDSVSYRTAALSLQSAFSRVDGPSRAAQLITEFHQGRSG